MVYVGWKLYLGQGVLFRPTPSHGREVVAFFQRIVAIIIMCPICLFRIDVMNDIGRNEISVYLGV